MADKAELREKIGKAFRLRKFYQVKTILFVKQAVETLN
jgi:hypothetical protein